MISIHYCLYFSFNIYPSALSNASTLSKAVLNSSLCSTNPSLSILTTSIIEKWKTIKVPQLSALETPFTHNIYHPPDRIKGLVSRLWLLQLFLLGIIWPNKFNVYLDVGFISILGHGLWLKTPLFYSVAFICSYSISQRCLSKC